MRSNETYLNDERPKITADPHGSTAVMVEFNLAPSEETRTALKALNFHFMRGAWHCNGSVNSASYASLVQALATILPTSVLIFPQTATRQRQSDILVATGWVGDVYQHEGLGVDGQYYSVVRGPIDATPAPIIAVTPETTSAAVVDESGVVTSTDSIDYAVDDLYEVRGSDRVYVSRPGGNWADIELAAGVEVVAGSFARRGTGSEYGRGRKTKGCLSAEPGTIIRITGSVEQITDFREYHGI